MPRNRWKLSLPLFALVTMSAISSLAVANAPPPRPRPQPVAPASTLKVEIKEGVTEAQLILPKKHAPAEKAKAEADGLSPTRTVVAGVSLSAALMMGGLFLARRKSAGRNATLAIAFVGAAGVLTAGMALADIAIPGQPYRPVRPPREDPPVILPDGTVPLKVEWVAEGEAKLIISPETAKSWANLQPPAKPEGK